MQVTHVKKYRRNSRRSRRQSMRRARPLSAVTSIGSFEPEIIENTKESNLNNIDSTTSETNNTSVSSKSQQTKTNRPPTTIKSLVRVFPSQPSPLTTNQSNNIQTTLYHPIHKACCSKLRLDQIAKHTLLSQTQVHPSQTSNSSGDYDQINAESLSKNSFLIRNNSHSTNRTISDRFPLDTSENNNRENSYLTEPTNKNHDRRRRLCNRFCRCCSPCYCLLTGLLISFLLAGLATLVTLITLSKTTITTTTTTTTVTTSTTTTTTTTVTTSTTTSTTTTTTTTSTSISTSTSSTSTSVTITTTTITAATTVTITSNACTSTWNGVTLFNLCTNCSNINPYQQYTYSYLAIATQTRITFSLREDVGYFALDDVSVRNILAPTVELLINGGFETGNLSSWIYCNPAGSAYPGIIKSTSDNFVARGQIYAAHGGNYYYLDGAVGNADYLSQTWQTNIGATYNISFWLYNQGSGSNSVANIIISI